MGGAVAVVAVAVAVMVGPTQHGLGPVPSGTPVLPGRAHIAWAGGFIRRTMRTCSSFGQRNTTAVTPTAGRRMAAAIHQTEFAASHNTSVKRTHCSNDSVGELNRVQVRGRDIWHNCMQQSRSCSMSAGVGSAACFCPPAKNADFVLALPWPCLLLLL